MAGGDDATRIKEEYLNCFTYEMDRECCGASGRKLRMVCVYCPNLMNYMERKDKEAIKCREKGVDQNANI